MKCCVLLLCLSHLASWKLPYPHAELSGTRVAKRSALLKRIKLKFLEAEMRASVGVSEYYFKVFALHSKLQFIVVVFLRAIDNRFCE